MAPLRNLHKSGTLCRMNRPPIHEAVEDIQYPRGPPSFRIVAGDTPKSYLRAIVESQQVQLFNIVVDNACRTSISVHQHAATRLLSTRH